MWARDLPASTALTSSRQGYAAGWLCPSPSPAASLTKQGHQGILVTVVSPVLLSPGSCMNLKPTSQPCLCCCRQDSRPDLLPCLPWDCRWSLPVTTPALIRAPCRKGHGAARAVSALGPGLLSLIGGAPLKLLPDIKCNEQLHSFVKTRACSDPSHKCIKVIHTTTDR